MIALVIYYRMTDFCASIYLKKYSCLKICTFIAWLNSEENYS